MNKIYYILVLTTLFFGCKREDDLTIKSKGTLELKASLNGMAESRAVSAVDFDTYGFHIAGYHTEGKFADAIAEDETLVFPNIFDFDKNDSQPPVPHVTKKDDKFVLSTVKWRLDQTSYLSYFAWTEAKTKDGVNGIVNASKDINDKGYPWIDVVNSSDYSKQVDLAAARHVDEKNHRVISAIDLNFKHILSKVTLKFKSSAGANVSISKMDLTYGTNMIFSNGRYTFNSNPVDSIGHFSNLNTYHSGSTSLGVNHKVDNGAEVVVGDLLLIPQSVAQGFLVLDLSYEISSGDRTLKHDKKVLLPAAELFAGTNHVFIVDIYSEQIIVHQTAVSDWVIDSTPRLPFVLGPKGNTQLHLDGFDKPYQHTNGVWYWLDRSGYNRHCELIGYDPSLYNETDHSYSLAALETSMISVPAFDAMTEITTDVVCQHASTGVNGNDIMQVVRFHTTDDNIRRFVAQMSLNNNGAIYFDCDTDALGRLVYTTKGGYDDFKIRTLWTFQKKDKDKSTIYQNASLVASRSAAGMRNLGILNKNQIAKGYNGKIFHVKVTSKMNEIKDIVRNYQNAVTKYGIPLDQTYLPPIQNGLIFCFDGRSGVKTVDGTKYWVDQVGKNDARMIGDVTYNSSEFYFEVPANKGKVNSSDPVEYAKKDKFMKLLFPVAMPNDFTAELVLKPNGRGSESPIFWGTSDAAGTSGRYLYMHLPYSTGNIFIDSPGTNRYNFGWPANVGGELIPRRVVIRRKFGAKSEFFMYNKVVASGDATTDIASVECSVVTFGGYDWGGRFYAVRLYDRALTDAEITQNHNFDKNTFKFTEN